MTVALNIGLLVLAGCTCAPEDLAEDGEARLRLNSGASGGVIALPHAPVAIPYLKRHSNVHFEYGDGDHRWALLETEPDEVRGRALRVDPDRSRFAVELGEGLSPPRWTPAMRRGSLAISFPSRLLL